MPNDNDAGDVGATPPEPRPVAMAATSARRSRRLRWPPNGPSKRCSTPSPYPLPEVSEDDLRRRREHARTARQQRSTQQAGGGPDRGRWAVSRSDQARTAGEFETLAGGYGYPAPFTRFEVPFPYTQYPFVTIGKVFFTQNGKNYVRVPARVHRQPCDPHRWPRGAHRGTGRQTAGQPTSSSFPPTRTTSDRSAHGRLPTWRPARTGSTTATPAGSGRTSVAPCCTP